MAPPSGSCSIGDDLLCNIPSSSSNNNNFCGFGEPIANMFGIDFGFGGKKEEGEADEALTTKEEDDAKLKSETEEEEEEESNDKDQADKKAEKSKEKEVADMTKEESDTKKNETDADGPPKSPKKKKRASTIDKNPKKDKDSKTKDKDKSSGEKKKRKSKKRESIKEKEKVKHDCDILGDMDKEEADDDVHQLLDDMEIEDFDMDLDALVAENDDNDNDNDDEKVDESLEPWQRVDWDERMAREEVFSKRYRPSKSETKELTELADQLGVTPPNGAFAGFRASIAVAMGNNETDGMTSLFYGNHSIILKRGPNLKWEEKTVDLILLTEGFVLTYPKYNRLNPLERRYETCHMWSQVDFCQKVNKSKFAIQLLSEERYELEIIENDEDKDENKDKKNETNNNDVKSWFKALERVFIEHSMHQGRPETFSDSLGWQYRLIRTPGYSAAVVGDPDIMGKPKNLNKLDKYNKLAPLHYAVQQEEANVKVVKTLLKKGAEPNFEDADGRCAMYYAERNKLNDIMKILVDKGGKPSKLAEMEERGELFGGAEHAAQNTERRRERDKLVKENEQAMKDEKAAKAAAKAGSAQSEMSKAMSALIERGEKIQQMDDKTKDLEAEAKTFKDLAGQLKEKAMKKKWYHL